MRHGPRRLRRGRCRCGLPLAECMLERAINAPATQGLTLYERYAREHQADERRRWRGAR